MGIVQEFKTFALKGNVVDLAVGVIIGASFGKIVSSLVDNIITPPLGMLIGGVDFSSLKLIVQSQPEVAVGYGIFLQAIFNFLIVAFALFFVIKLMNRLMRQPPAAPPGPPPPPPEDVLLLREIRDALRK